MEFVIPKAFKPYPQIKFCNNIFINMLTLLDDNGFYPLLIGKDKIPRIWIYVKNNIGETIALIKDNIAISPILKVNIYSTERKITITTIDKLKLLDIYYEEDIPEVTYIDLKTLGYNIVGNRNELTVGNTVLSQTKHGDKDINPIIALRYDNR